MTVLMPAISEPLNQDKLYSDPAVTELPIIDPVPDIPTAAPTSEALGQVKPWFSGTRPATLGCRTLPKLL